MSRAREIASRNAGTIGGTSIVNTSGSITTTGGLTVGVDGTGQDVKFFADDSGSFMNWDESENTLEIRGGGEAYGIAEGKLLLSSAEASIVQGNKLGQIDFQAPLENTGGTTGDQRLVGASIWAVADNTFSSTVNETELVFALGNSETAVEKMRLTKKGALRLDHSSPQNTSNMDTHAIEVVRVPNDDAAELNISFLHNAPSGYTSSGDHLGGILFGGASQGGTVYHGLAAIKANASAAWATGGSGDAPAELTFHTTPDGSVTPAERMVISKDGYVGINTTSPTRPLDVHGPSGSNVAQFRHGDANGTIVDCRFETTSTPTDGANYIRFGDANSNNGHIQSSGSGSAVNYASSSDYRLKENVEAMTGSITRLKNLKPYKFNFKKAPDIIQDGFFAHEVGEVVPLACSGEKDAMTPEVLYTKDDELPEGKSVGDIKEESVIDPQGVDPSKIVPLLVGALQEAVVRIEALENA